MLAFWGMGPAPARFTNPERGEAWQARENMKETKKREREPGRVRLQ